MTDNDLIAAASIDQLIASPEADRAEVAEAAREAAELGLRGIIVPAALLPGDTGEVAVTALAGYPSGKHHSLIKATEARLAVDAGGRRVAVVADLGAAVARRHDEVFVDVLTVREAVGEEVELTVIVEAAALLARTDEETLAEVCRRVAQAGAAVICTATGHHPAGPATPSVIRLIRRAVPSLTLQAGAVEDAAAAAAALAAGADRLSSTVPGRLLGFSPS